jgi:hypothetical protein
MLFRGFTARLAEGREHHDDLGRLNVIAADLVNPKCDRFFLACVLALDHSGRHAQARRPGIGPASCEVIRSGRSHAAGAEVVHRRCDGSISVDREVSILMDQEIVVGPLSDDLEVVDEGEVDRRRPT